MGRGTASRPAISPLAASQLIHVETRPGAERPTEEPCRGCEAKRASGRAEWPIMGHWAHLSSSAARAVSIFAHRPDPKMAQRRLCHLLRVITARALNLDRVRRGDRDRISRCPLRHDCHSRRQMDDTACYAIFRDGEIGARVISSHERSSTMPGSPSYARRRRHGRVRLQRHRALTVGCRRQPAVRMGLKSINDLSRAAISPSHCWFPSARVGHEEPPLVLRRRPYPGLRLGAAEPRRRW
jgi:hypothetical protein